MEEGLAQRRTDSHRKNSRQFRFRIHQPYMEATRTLFHWGYPTLTFDISIFDITMLIAIIVLFALYLTSTPKENPTQKPASKKLSIAKKTTQRTPRPQKTENNSNTDEKSECPHHYGYLKARKGKGVPEECVGCTKLVQCLFTEE